MLANKIMTLRKQAGMSQLQLAQKMNVSPSTIGMYEQGRRTPAIDILIQMANIFGVSLDYLITGSEFSSFGASEIDSVTHALRPCIACCFCCNKHSIKRIRKHRNEDKCEGASR